MSNMSVQATNAYKPKKNYVKRGALIGAGAQVAFSALQAGTTIKAFGKDQFISSINGIGKARYAGMLAFGIATTAAFGAGIGKIVEICKNKKAEKAE